jgi:hypothetical protein
MTESSSPYAQVSAASFAPVAAAGAPMYVVAIRKLVILHVATCGMYALYWFYRQWSDWKQSQPYDSAGGRIWPVMRAIFALFFVHALFREVKASGRDDARVAAWDEGATATWLVLTLVASAITSRLSARSIGSPFTDVAELLLMLPEVLLLARAQRMVNAACGDPAGVTNAGFTAANVAWMVLGGVVWLLVAAGIFLPAPG